jgi:hypothetical protein
MNGAIVPLHLYVFVACTGTTLRVSLPLVYKMFIRVIQLSFDRFKGQSDRNTTLKFNSCLTENSDRIIRVIRLIDV